VVQPKNGDVFAEAFQVIAESGDFVDGPESCGDGLGAVEWSPDEGVDQAMGVGVLESSVLDVRLLVWRVRRASPPKGCGRTWSARRAVSDGVRRAPWWRRDRSCAGIRFWTMTV
jgi:hypothetical protein